MYSILMLNIILTHLQHDFFHLFIRRLELSDKDEHDFSGIVVCILSVHEWNQVTNSLQKGRQTLVKCRNRSLVSYRRYKSISVQTIESILDIPFLCVDVYPSIKASERNQMTQCHRE